MLNKEHLIAVALSLMLVSLVAVFTPPLQYSDDVDIWTERTVFYWMAEQPFSQDVPDKANTAPWTYRILTPTIIHLIPLDTITAYYLLNFTFLVLTCIVLYFLLRRLKFSHNMALLGIVLFSLLEWTVHCTLYVNILIEPLTFLLITVAFYALASKRDWLFALALILGTLNKEVMLLLIPVYFFWKLRENGFKSAILYTAVIAAIPIAEYMLLRAIIPALSWHGHLWYFWHYLIERTASIEVFLYYLFDVTFNTWSILILLPLFNPKILTFLRHNLHYLVYGLACFSFVLFSAPMHSIYAFPVMIILSLKGVEYINRQAIPWLLLFHILLSDTFGWFAAMSEPVFAWYNMSKIVFILIFVAIWFVWFVTLPDELIRRKYGKSIP